MGDVVEFYPHDFRQRIGGQLPVDDRLEAGQQRGLEVLDKQWADRFHQHGGAHFAASFGYRFSGGHDLFAAEIGCHHNDGVAEVDHTTFAVAHEAPVEHLVKQVQHVAVGLFNLVEQDHAIGALTYRFGQHATLAVANIARRRPFQLRYRVRFLILGQVDRDERAFPAEHQIGQRTGRLGLADPRRTGQQEYAERGFVGFQAGLRCAQALTHGCERIVLPNHDLPESHFQIEQGRQFILKQAAHWHAGPVGDDACDRGIVDFRLDQGVGAMSGKFVVCGPDLVLKIAAFRFVRRRLPTLAQRDESSNGFFLAGIRPFQRMEIARKQDEARIDGRQPLSNIGRRRALVLD